MLIKVSLFFLLIMAGLALFGRVRLAKRRSAFCPDCGRPASGLTPCGCKGRGR